MTTNEEMNLEIQEAIKKSLPSQVGEALKQRLEQADKDSNTVKLQSETITKLQSDVTSLNGIISDYKKFDERNNLLVAREKSCDEKERNQKVFEAELKASSAEARANEMAGFVGLVFKSPIFRNTVQGNMPMQGGQYGTTSHSFFKTIDKSEA